MSDQRLKIILIDDGGWVSKTFIHEVKTNRKDVDIEEIIQVAPNAPLKEILDKIPAPDELEIEEIEHIDIMGNKSTLPEVVNKTTIWLPFSMEGCLKRNLREELNQLQGDYPYLSVALYYEQMARPWLHELARKAKIVPMDHMVDEDGKSTPAPQKLTTANVIEKTFQNKYQGKFKIKVLKSKEKEKSALDQIKENKDEGNLFPENTGIDEEGSGTDTGSKKKKGTNK